MNLGQRITALRNKKGKTQDQMAEMLGVKRARYNAWENGISNPDYEHLTALAKLHHVTTDFLLGLPHNENNLLLTSEMYADGYTDESVLAELEENLNKIHNKNAQNDEHTIAANHDGENWTEEELNEIKRFKEFIKAKRDNKDE